MGFLSDFFGGAEKKASRAMQEGYQQGIDWTKGASAQTRSDLSPYLSLGRSGTAAYGDALGLNGLDRAAQSRANFQFSPGYQFALGEMNRNTLNGGGATGSLLSGDTLKGLQGNANGLANQEWGSYLDQLAGVTNIGLRGAGTQAMSDVSYADAIAQMLGQKGEAKASGILGASNVRRGLLGDAFSAAGSLFGFG